MTVLEPRFLAAADLLVNTFTTGLQAGAAVAADADGGFVVAWTSGDAYTGQDGDGWGVFAQRYAADGTPRGSEFQVNSYTSGSQAGAVVAMAADGDFVVAWTSAYGQDGDGWGVFARRYAANGTPQGGEFQVNTTTIGSQREPSVAMAANGDFVVAWNGGHVYAQRYTADGTAHGNEFRVNTYTDGSVSHPSVAMDADGNFVVAWDGSGQEQDLPMYPSGDGIYAQRYDSVGNALGSELHVNTFLYGSQQDPSVAMDADGDFVVVWRSMYQDGSGDGVFAQRYAADGTTRGSEFQVNTQVSGEQWGASVAMDADGEFVVAWHGPEPVDLSYSQYGVYAQRYAADGTTVGGELQLNVFTAYQQWMPSVAMGADGDFVVAWDGEGSDDFYGVFMPGDRLSLLGRPVITDADDDTGSSGLDRVTYDTSLTVSGTAEPGSAVTVYRQGPADPGPVSVGTATADGGGAWSVALPAAVPAGVQRFTATASLSGVTSARSAEYRVAVDTAPPDVSLVVPTQTYDRTPPVYAAADDRVGLPAAGTAYLDVDLNNDNDFADAGEAGYASAPLDGGSAVFDAYSPLAPGTVRVRVRAADLAGNEGASAARTVAVQASPTAWPIEAATVTTSSGGDPTGADGGLYAGNVVRVFGFDLDVSAAACDCQNPYARYDSQTGNPTPAVHVTLRSDAALGVPDHVYGTLTWDGATGSQVDYDLSGLSPGADWVFGAAPTTSLGTGRHTYTLSLFVDFPGTADDHFRQASGSTFLVNRADSPYGAGWGFSNVDALVTVPADGTYPAGVLRVGGKGGWAFHEDLGGGAYAADADGGTLAAAGTGWAYASASGRVKTFDAAGRMTAWSYAGETLTYTYDASGGVATVAAPDGAVATFAYSGGLLRTVTAPGNRVVTLTHTGTDLTRIDGPGGAAADYAYADHRMTAAASGAASEAFAYDASGLLAGRTAAGVARAVAPALAAGLGAAADAGPWGKLPASRAGALGGVERAWYDGGGRPVAGMATVGGVRRYDRDANGHVVRYTDALDRVTTYAVDSAGRVLGETRPDGTSAAWEYAGANGSLTRYADHRGGVHTYTNDADGRRLTETDPLGRTTTYAYAGGLLRTVTDPLGDVTTYLYDVSRRPTGTLVGGAVTGTVGYDAAGNPATLADPLGNVTTTTYDGAGRVVAVTDPLGNVTTTTYDAGGFLLSVTDPLGRTTSYAYDGAGRVVETVGGYGTGLERRTTSVYDDDARVAETVDPLGNRTTSVLDAAGRVVAAVDPLGNRTDFRYDREGQLLSATDPLGRVTTHGYDLLGRRVATTDALGGVWTSAYDANSNPVAAVDPLGSRSTAVYDAADRLTATVDPLGNRTSYAYDAAGRLQAVTDPRGSTATTGYDARGRVWYAADALGNRVTLGYDAADNRVTVTDPLGRTTTTVYDELGRAVAAVDPLGNRSTVVYDAAGQAVAAVDPLGRRTTTGYDALGRAVETTDALGHVWTTVYDAADRAVASVTPLGHRSTAAYDAAGRVVESVDAGGNRTVRAYDAAGQLVAVTDALGRTTRTGYDALGRAVATTDPLGNTWTTAYDAAGRAVSATDPLGHTATTVYDAASRVLASVDPLGNRTSYGYDAAGNRVSVTDPLGRTTTTVYDELGRAVAAVDPLGNRSTVVYDAAGQAVAAVDPLGRRTTTGYDAAGRAATTTDALGNVWTAAYDAAGNAVSSTDPLGRTATAVYDALDRAVVAIDPLGHRTTSAYDAGGNLATVTDPLDRVTSFGYDARGLRVSATDALGNVWTTAYDALGRAVRETDPLGRTARTAYDAAGRAVASVDPLGNRTTAVYDAAGRVVASVDPLGNRTTAVYDAAGNAVASVDALGHRWTTTYDASGNAVESTDPLGRVTTAVYDAADRRTATVDALGNRSTVVYDAAGNAVVTIDPLGRRTTAAYDALDRVSGVTDPLGGVSTTTYDAAGNVATSADPLGRVTSFVYDPRGLRVATTDALGNVWTTAYDAAGNAVASTDPLGNTSTTAYDAAGNAVTRTDPRGNVTTTAYDALNRPAAVTDALGGVWTTAYDAAGNRVASVDPLGHATTAVYDALDRVVATVTPLGFRATAAYDAAGNVLAETDPLGRVTTRAYDALDRRVATTDPRGFTTTSVYDAAGNRTVLIDASGNHTTWAFDALDRVVAETNPLNATATVAYDAAGRRTGETDRLGRRRDFGYDAAGRLTTEAWYAAGGALAQTQTWAYDAASRVLTAADPDGTYTRAYDAAGRVAAVEGPFGVGLTFGYDAAGNRVTVEDSLGGVTTAAFDALNRQVSEQLGGAGVSEARFDYAYNPRGERGSLTRYADLAGTSVVGTTAYGYDADGRLTHLVHADGAGSPLAEYTYAYDAASRLTGKVEDGVTTSYAYDAADQLTADGAATFGYDATGNRTNAGYATGSGNRISTDGVWTYTHDAGGNVTKKSKGASAETWVYAYDNRNQMLTATQSATDGGAATASVTYAYDAFGNRIQRQAWDGTTTATERYGLDGWDTAKPSPTGNEAFDPILDLDGSNAVTMRRAWGTGFDEVVARQSALGTVAWYGADYQGSVRQVFDNSGSVLTTATYSAFGELVGGSLGDRLGYTGHDRDTVTGLIMTPDRPIDPATGLFMSRDRIWPKTGEPNPYTYVRNSPTNYTDPSGMALYAWDKATAEDISAWLAGEDVGESDTVRYLGRIPAADAVKTRIRPVGSEGRFLVALADEADRKKVGTLIYANFPGIKDRAKVAGIYAGLYDEKTRFGRVNYMVIFDPDANGIELPHDKKKYVFKVDPWDEIDPTVAGDWKLKSSNVQTAMGNNLEWAPTKPNAVPWWDSNPKQVVSPPVDREAILAKQRSDQAAMDIAGLLIPARDYLRLLQWLAGRVCPVQVAGGGAFKPTNPAVFPARPAFPLEAPPIPVPFPSPATQQFSVFGLNLRVPLADLGPACFAPGTPLITPGGSKAIEEFVAGDIVLSRHELDPGGEVVPKVVEEVFLRVSRVLAVRVGRQTIRTTGEHPFWVQGKGWLPARELMAGDSLTSHDSQPVIVSEVVDTGRCEAVYNLRVADFHTYFVGRDEWGFSVWAHNDYGTFLRRLGGGQTTEPLQTLYRDLVNEMSKPGVTSAQKVELWRLFSEDTRVVNAIRQAQGSGGLAGNANTLKSEAWEVIRQDAAQIVERRAAPTPTDLYKKELFERPGKPRSASSVRGAQIELAGGQVEAAVEQGVIFDHITKVRNAQRGLRDRIQELQRELQQPNLVPNAKQLAEAELKEASRLLDEIEGIVPPRKQ